jgi:hypothetical protein
MNNCILKSKNSVRRFATMSAGCTLAALSLAAAPLAGQTPPSEGHFQFANIPWGSPDSVVTARLADAGFTFSKKDKDGDLWYEGNLKGQKTDVLAFMTPERQVVFIVLNLETPDDDAIPMFRNIRDGVLTTRYGVPAANTDTIPSPNEPVDSLQEKAVRDGEENLVAIWGDPDTNDYLGITVTEMLTVRIEYCSPLWTAENARRESLRDSIF